MSNLGIEGQALSLKARTTIKAPVILFAYTPILKNPHGQLFALQFVFNVEWIGLLSNHRIDFLLDARYHSVVI